MLQSPRGEIYLSEDGTALSIGHYSKWGAFKFAKNAEPFRVRGRDVPDGHPLCKTNHQDSRLLSRATGKAGLIASLFQGFDRAAYAFRCHYHY
jgi:hypothetical protein